jgi:hypothetical protein
VGDLLHVGATAAGHVHVFACYAGQVLLALSQCCMQVHRESIQACVLSAAIPVAQPSSHLALSMQCAPIAHARLLLTCCNPDCPLDLSPLQALAPSPLACPTRSSSYRRLQQPGRKPLPRAACSCGWPCH